MEATAIYIPRGIGIGDPPQRIADIVYVYPDGLAVAWGDKRKVVFDSLRDVRLAMRSLSESKTPVSEESMDGWLRVAREVDQKPCRECRRLHSESEEHRHR